MYSAQGIIEHHFQWKKKCALYSIKYGKFDFFLTQKRAFFAAKRLKQNKNNKNNYLIFYEIESSCSSETLNSIDFQIQVQFSFQFLSFNYSLSVILTQSDVQIFKTYFILHRRLCQNKLVFAADRFKITRPLFAVKFRTEPMWSTRVNTQTLDLPKKNSREKNALAYFRPAVGDEGETF
jgi:hypothetical protein